MGYLILPVLRVLGWFFYLLPEPLRGAWVWCLGGLLARLQVRARVIEHNLGFAFPGKNPATRQLTRAAYAHVARLTLEILMLFGPMRSYVLRNVEIRGDHHIRKALKRGRGVILMSSHVGNWEVMAAGAPLILKIPILFVTKRLKPAWLHEAVERARARYEVRATYEPRTLKDVLRELKSNGVVGFVLDQYAGAPVGVRVPVFGIPVGTTTAIAALVKRTGAALIPVVNYRIRGGKFIIEVRPEVPWQAGPNPSRELAANTARYAAAIERDIYSHPEQWLWTHRRFKGDLTPLRPGEWDEKRART